MYQVSGSILSDDSEVLPGVEITEVNVFGFPIKKTMTDEDGRFQMPVISELSELHISLFGYFTVIINAKDFMVDSLVYLKPAVEKIQGKTQSNMLLYGLLGASAVLIIYLVTKDQPQPKPKQIKIA